MLEELLKDAIDRGDIYRTAAGWERRQIERAAPARPRSATRSCSASSGCRRTPSRSSRPPPSSASTVRPDLLPGVCGCDTGRASKTALVTLVGEQLLDVDADGRRYRFRHALTREAVYDDIVLPRRQALHSRAADALAARRRRADRSARQAPVRGRPLRPRPCRSGCRPPPRPRIGRASRRPPSCCLRALPHVTDDLERAPTPRAHRSGHVARRRPARARERYLAEAIPLAERGRRSSPRRERATWCWVASTGSSRARTQARVEYERARALLEPLGPSRGPRRSLCPARQPARLRIRSTGGAIELLDRAIAVAEAARRDAPRVWALGFPA